MALALEILLQTHFNILCNLLPLSMDTKMFVVEYVQHMSNDTHRKRESVRTSPGEIVIQSEGQVNAAEQSVLNSIALLPNLYTKSNLRPRVECGVSEPHPAQPFLFTRTESPYNFNPHCSYGDVRN